MLTYLGRRDCGQHGELGEGTIEGMRLDAFPAKQSVTAPTWRDVCVMKLQVLCQLETCRHIILIWRNWVNLCSKSSRSRNSAVSFGNDFLLYATSEKNVWISAWDTNRIIVWFDDNSDVVLIFFAFHVGQKNCALPKRFSSWLLDKLCIRCR